jgi:ribonuclease BN (tRNA processing enzyme)
MRQKINVEGISMKITFLGVSGALSPKYNSNMLIDQGEDCILFDCGEDVMYSLKDAGRTPEELDAVYISHLHYDHMGGLSWLGYYSMFVMKRRLALYIHESLISDLWAMLRPAMEKLDGHDMQTLEDYFWVNPMGGINEWTIHRSLCFKTVLQPHVETPQGNMYSYGLSLHESTLDNGRWRPFVHRGKCVSISSDSKRIKMLPSYAYEYDLIFCDCDVMNLGGVHANYDDLKKMTQDIKYNMWLYHYHDLGDKMPDAVADGFAGFVKEGQVFEI